MSRSPYKFAHNIIHVFSRGKLRVQCGCGKQSSLFSDTEDATKEEQASEWVIKHTGLIEMKPKPTEA